MGSAEKVEAVVQFGQHTVCFTLALEHKLNTVPSRGGLPPFSWVSNIKKFVLWSSSTKSDFFEKGGFQVVGGTSRKSWSHYSSFHQLFLSINFRWGVSRDPVQSPLEQDGNSLEVAHLLTLLLTSVAS